MDPVAIERLKQHYEFGEWRGRAREPAGLFFYHVGPHLVVLPGWVVHRVHRLQSPDRRTTQLQSVWRPAVSAAPVPASRIPVAGTTPEAPPERLLRVDLFECDSRPSAQDLLIDLLGQVQVPDFQRGPGPEVGDVSFHARRGQYLVFARANVVVALGAAGEKPVDVAPLGQGVDAQLVARPEAQEVATATQRVGSDAAFEITEHLAGPHEAATEPPSYKLYYQGGELQRRGKAFALSTRGAGRVEVAVYEMVAGQPARLRTILVEGE